MLGTSVTHTPAIMAAAREDLDFAIEFITLDGTSAQRQGALQPESFDVYDQWFHDLDLIWPTASVQPIEVARIERWNEINDLPKTGRLRPDTPRAAGCVPCDRLFVQGDGTLDARPTSHVSMVPTVHNADGFAVVGAEGAVGPVQSWGALLDPDWTGRTVLQSDAAIGTLDMLFALMARNEITVADPGNLALEEIDRLTEEVVRYRDAGHFRGFWADEAGAVATMREGPVIGSMWWSGAVRLRAAGAPLTMVTPEEGHRAWFGGLSLSARIDDRAKDAAYSYMNWWLSGRPGAIMACEGAYIANPEAARSWLERHEWDFWYAGLPAERAITDASGRTIYAVGEAREGGSYEQRMSHLAVWDTVMDEHNYLVRRWEEALRR